MKKSSDPRHQKRRKLVQELFAWQFNESISVSKNLKPLIEDLPKIDKEIKAGAPLWPIDQINKIDLAILRLSIYELLLKSNPKKVVIDEAIELAKEFGSENSPSFVNGVLGKVTEHV